MYDDRSAFQLEHLRSPFWEVQARQELVNSLSQLSAYGNSVCFWSLTPVSTQTLRVFPPYLQH